jgi:hypothetical protein
MTRIEIADDRLNLKILGWDKLWSFKKGFDIPLEHVAGVRRWEKAKDGGARGIRSPGTMFPGVIVAGTYHRKGEHVFYDVHRFKNAIVIELQDEWYARLIVEVEEPVSTVGLISRSLAHLVEA